jgi:ADP-heptose:LPS heptosyltransferase
LQKNEGSEQLKYLQSDLKVETLPDSFDYGENAFLDSAAILKCVDLVISSDTALTHLAGALNCKTWLPLKLSPDWRWLLDRENSPWYQSLRLYRQAAVFDWSEAFANLKQNL